MMFFKPLSSNSSLEVVRGCADIYSDYLVEVGHNRTINPVDKWRSVTRSLFNYYVQDNDEVIAIGSFNPNREAGSAMLHNIAVDEYHRHKGVGRFMVERIEREIDSLGISFVELNSTGAGIPFYERLGYQRDNLLSNYFYKLIS